MAAPKAAPQAAESQTASEMTRRAASARPARWARATREVVVVTKQFSRKTAAPQITMLGPSAASSSVLT